MANEKKKVSPADRHGPVMSKATKVIAIKDGFYRGCRYRKGAAFTLDKGMRLSNKWMRRASDVAKIPAPKKSIIDTTNDAVRIGQDQAKANAEGSAEGETPDEPVDSPE